MSKDQIRPDDLVMRVHSCCEALPHRKTLLGVPYTVRSFSVINALCPYCGFANSALRIARFYEHDGYTAVAWLKKLPPLSEPESVTHEKEVEHG